MNKFSTRCLLACLAACATASIADTARAVDATPDVEVGIPDVIYLKTFSKFVCNFPATSLLAAGANNPVDTSSGTATVEATGGTVAVGSISKDAAIGVVSPFTTIGSQKCDALNAFAVWGTGGAAGNVKVDTVVTTAALAHTTTATSTMTLSSANFAANGTAFATPIATSTFAAPGLSTPYKGDIRLDLNITNATRSGNYTGGKITISANSL